MELTFETTVTVGNNTARDKKYFTINYTPSKSDFNEFARECGYKDFADLITCNKKLKEIEETENCLNRFNNDKLYLIEIYLNDLDIEKEFTNYLINKYQTEFEIQLLEKISIINEDEINLNKGHRR